MHICDPGITGEYVDASLGFQCYFSYDKPVFHSEFIRYMRAVAYRNFTRMVYGILGKRRIALPACAYNAIHHTFETKEELVGFEDIYE